MGSAKARRIDELGRTLSRSAANFNRCPAGVGFVIQQPWMVRCSESGWLLSWPGSAPHEVFSDFIPNPGGLSGSSFVCLTLLRL